MPAPQLEALQFEQNQLFAKADALLQIDASGNPIPSATPPTAEQIAEATTIATQARTIGARIAAMENLREIQRTAPAAVTAAVASGRETTTVTPNVDPRFGFKDLGHMALTVRDAVVNGRHSPLLDAIKSGAVYNAGTGFAQDTNSTEGWEVAPEFKAAIWDLTFEGTDLMGLLEMEPTNSNSVEMGKDETTPWGSTGVQALWRVEAETMTATSMALSGVRTELNELYAFVAATEELLNDAPRLQDRLTKKAAAAIEWVGSEGFYGGDGVGKPLGFTRSPALITVSKESGQAAGTLNVTNIAKMYSQLYVGNGANVLWLGNSTILTQLIQLVIGNVPVWLPMNEGFKGKPGGNLLGIPLMFTEHNSGLGALNDLILVNLAGYYSAKRSGGPEYAESIHIYFDTGKKAFRWTFRIGGRPILSGAIQPPTGKNGVAKSHFVNLQAR
jgi:HK97 family phage major capsid protein